MTGRINIGNLQMHEMRISTGLTQSKLAQLAGVSKATVSRLENGDMHCNISSCVKICRTLKCHLDDLFQENRGID